MTGVRLGRLFLPHAVILILGHFVAARRYYEESLAGFEKLRLLAGSGLGLKASSVG